MNDSDDIVKEFLVESYENLDRLDQDLLQLERNPNDREILASVFRTIHTIKGTSGFLNFNQLGAVTHVGESLLGLLRDGQKALDRDITNALLAMVDTVRQILASIEATGGEGERNDDGLISRLTRLQRPAEAAGRVEARSEVKAAAAAGAAAGGSPEMGSPQTNAIASDAVDSDGVVSSQMVSNPLVSKPVVNNAITAEEAKPAGIPAPAVNVAERVSVPAAAASAEATDAQRPQASPGQSAADSTIRVDVSLLDKLMNLVGELVLARNQILQFANRTEESGLLATSQRLNLITTELQEGVMKTRMQPIGNIWSKFPRVVRDLATRCGKQVRIEMEGKETELDKTIIEAIKDPLTHIGAQCRRSRHREAREARGARASPRRAGCSCAPSTRADRSISRSPTTAAGSTWSGSSRRRLRTRLITRRTGGAHERPRRC